MVECMNILSIDSTSAPLILDGPQTSPRPAIILDDREATSHYLDNIRIEFKGAGEGLDAIASSIDRCLTDEAVKTFEVHCEAIKISSPSTARLTQGHHTVQSWLISSGKQDDLLMDDGEPVFSVDSLGLAFKTSSCKLESSGARPSAERRRQLQPVKTAGYPCILRTSFSAEQNVFVLTTLDVTYLLTNVHNCGFISD